MINLLKKVVRYLFRKKLIQKPIATKEHYLRLHEQCRQDVYRPILSLEAEYGYAINNDYFENLALHTQVCVKKSKLNYQHGKLLYIFLRAYIENNFESQNMKLVNVFETGTARGFSSICMAKAIIDSGKPGHIISCDLLPHYHRRYWNCIDDLSGKKTREELLSPWSEETRLITFVHGKIKNILDHLGCSRIHFAFLDATHAYKDVKAEFDYVSKRQNKGDCIVFDDVTDALFPGVVKAVKEIESSKEYSISYISLSDQRGYAIATKAG